MTASEDIHFHTRIRKRVKQARPKRFDIKIRNCKPPDKLEIQSVTL